MIEMRTVSGAIACNQDLFKFPSWKLFHPPVGIPFSEFSVGNVFRFYFKENFQLWLDI